MCGVADAEPADCYWQTWRYLDGPLWPPTDYEWQRPTTGAVLTVMAVFWPVVLTGKPWPCGYFGCPAWRGNRISCQWHCLLADQWRNGWRVGSPAWLLSGGYVFAIIIYSRKPDRWPLRRIVYQPYSPTITVVATTVLANRPADSLTYGDLSMTLFNWRDQQCYHSFLYSLPIVFGMWPWPYDDLTVRTCPAMLTVTDDCYWLFCVRKHWRRDRPHWLTIQWWLLTLTVTVPFDRDNATCCLTWLYHWYRLQPNDRLWWLL